MAPCPSEATKFDYNLIPVLITIVETCSMVAAAEVLDVTPSVISYSVKKLRAHYNDPLFIRTLNGVKPTALAKNLYEKFKVINGNIINTLGAPQVIEQQPRIVYIQADPIIELLITTCLISKGIVPNECTLCFKKGAILAEERLYKLRNQEVDLDVGFSLAGDKNIISNSSFCWNYILACRKGHKTVGDGITKEQFNNEKYVAYNANLYSTVVVNDMNELVNQRELEPEITSESAISLVLTILYSDLLLIIPDVFYNLFKSQLPIRKVNCDFIPDSSVNIFTYTHKKNVNDDLLNKIIFSINKIK